MQQDLDKTIAILTRTPSALDALLRGLPDEWTRRNEGADSWSPFDVVGHLIYGERTDWMPRARWILAHNTAKPFEPFDRLGHVQESKGKSMDELLDEFARVRNESLSGLRALNVGPKELALKGRHPALGEVTLSELLATWAVHDMTHLHQISRVIAHQYREAVGPWSQYLGVLDCKGHSG
jgi:DinB family protein